MPEREGRKGSEKEREEGRKKKGGRKKRKRRRRRHDGTAEPRTCSEAADAKDNSKRSRADPGERINDRPIRSGTRC